MDTNFLWCSTWSLLLVLIQVPFLPPLCVVCLYVFCLQTSFPIPPWQHIFASSFRGDRFRLILRKMIYIYSFVKHIFCIIVIMIIFFVITLCLPQLLFSCPFRIWLNYEPNLGSSPPREHGQWRVHWPFYGVVAENMGFRGQHTWVWILVLSTTSYVIIDKLSDSSPLSQFVHL